MTIAPSEPTGRIVRHAAFVKSRLAAFSASTTPAISTSFQEGEGQYVLGMTQMTAYLTIALGSADWVEYQFLYSFDGRVFVPKEGDAPVRITDSTYSARVAVPILDHYVAVQVRGSGTLTTTTFVCDAVFGSGASSTEGGAGGAGSGVNPLATIGPFTMNSNADDQSDAFQIRGDGVVRAEITLPDTTSADGEFYYQTGSSGAGPWYTEPVPVLPKVAGIALTAVPLTFVNPGSTWCRLIYIRTSGGAASEISVASIVIW